MTQRTSAAALEAFIRKHPRKIDLSLERLQLIANRLGHPERRLPPVIHVAGTNGKGSTLAFLRAIMDAAGLSVHAYTSPHLVRYHERIRLAGSLIGDDHLADVLWAVSDAAGDDPITLFEAITAAAFLAFSQVEADVLLLEVGLGGRLDATNILPRSEVGVITPVSLDHMEFLGADVAGIAREKAGIARRGVPLVVNQPDPMARDAIEESARQSGAHPVIAGRHFEIVAEDQGGWTYKDARGTLTLPQPALPGAFQTGNAALAIAALRHQTRWTIPDSAFSAGLRWAQWPARLQKLTTGHLLDMLPAGAQLWVDGGHNEAAGAQVATFVRSCAETHKQPIHAVVAMLSNKDLPGYLTPFAGCLDGLWGLPLAGHAHHSPADIAAQGQSLGVPGRVGADIEKTLKTIAETTGDGPAPIVFILGSLYQAGAALEANGTVPD